MALDENTLAVELAAMLATEDEADAIQFFTDAYEVYLLDAEAGPVTITPAGIALGKTAAAAAMVGMSAANAGLSIIPNAIITWWTTMAASPAVTFPGAIAMVPPPHAGILAGFAPIMVSNTASELETGPATANVATLFHSQAIVGGTITLPGAPPTIHPIV